MNAWPRNDEIRSSGWSGAEQQFEPPEDEIDQQLCRNIRRGDEA